MEDKKESMMDDCTSISTSITTRFSEESTGDLDRQRNNRWRLLSDAEEIGSANEPIPCPNDPHPSLEFPPLYFGLGRFPKFRERIKKLYSWRWSMSYPLQKRVKGSKILRYLGIYLTYGEILLFIPLAALAVYCIWHTWVVPSCSASGELSRLSVAAALLFAQKNSYITMVLGVPFDRAVAYHKASGYIAVGTGLLHTVTILLDSTQKDKMVDVDRRGFHELIKGPMNLSGTLILACIIGLFITALPVIRRRFFEFFYYTHLLLLLGIVAGTAVHTGFIVPVIVTGTTGFDFFIRKVLMARFMYPQKATLKVISDSVVEVSFPKVAGFEYNPGQFGK